MPNSQTTAEKLEEGALAGPGVPGLVSVVVPTYNRATIVRAAIDSVVGQSYPNVEVVVVDDGSRDDTQRVVESYGAPVRYLFQANSGVSAARNRGFAAARGEFIALLDSDDAFLPWKLEAQVRVLRAHPEVGMVWTDMAAVNEQGELLDPKYLRTFYDAHALAKLEEVLDHAGPLSNMWPGAPPDIKWAPVYTGEIFSQMLLGNLVHTSTVVVRRDRLRQTGGFDTTLTHSGEDYEFHLRTSSHGPVALIDASSLLYRIGAADQLTAAHLGIHRARNNLTTVLRWLERGAGRIQLSPRTVRDRLAQAFRWVGEAELEYGDRGRARENLWKSLRYAPGHGRSMLLLLFACLPPAALHGARRLKRLAHRAVPTVNARSTPSATSAAG
ncbi:MAG TPA: glycosyltransferase family 2 protein [Gemmatimonadales bacterium]|nr:glycosyltransferase family 2 protein [Gemmatimonadales bacterium]